ncbi:MAG: type II secretion system protein [Prosthecobacter sp.]
MPRSPTFSLRHRPGRLRAAGFSFVEAIFTIAIIGIMSSLVVAAISNASKDAHRVMARQQQAAVQSAVTAWVMAQVRVATGPTAGSYRSLESVRSFYNSQPTTRSRFELLQANPSATDVTQRAGFLDPVTVAHFMEYTFNSDRLETAALKNADQYLSLPDWESGDFPRCMMNDE